MKSNRILVLILLLTLAIIVLALAFWMPFRTKMVNLDYFIYDSNNNFKYEVGEELQFIMNDTTGLDNRSVLWQFGNGDSLKGKKLATYTFQQEGTYLVTLEVDKHFKIPKYVDVIGVHRNTAYDSIPKIYGPNQGFVNEELVFLTNTPGINSWQWEFGETNTPDAYEQQVVYTYKKPGTYIVKLTTNQNKYPIFHRIEISSMFEHVLIDPIDSVSIVEKDIQKRLQAIADASLENTGGFYKNVKYLKNTYQCGTNMVIKVNGSKYYDLYSYCQGLHHLSGSGSKKITINEVEVDTVRCIPKIAVTQSITQKK
ncbi:MAG: PKD domain-containing protein [Flavobacteriaceae bacterium]|nr:PKD domain-containing protein [Flavobacteriaceae bacterium]